METLDRLLDEFGECLTPEVAGRIAALRAHPQAQKRLDELAEKNSNGELTDDEAAELEAYIRAGELISILQMKARSVLSRSEPR